MNLPVGTKYIITESDYSGEGYVASVKTGDEDYQEKRTVNGTIEDELQKDVQFKNTRQGIIPTGIYMNTLIPILLLFISIAGVIILLIRSRKWKNRLEE